jgi:hypothetical protein
MNSLLNSSRLDFRRDFRKLPLSIEEYDFSEFVRQYARLRGTFQLSHEETMRIIIGRLDPTGANGIDEVES